MMLSCSSQRLCESHERVKPGNSRGSAALASPEKGLTIRFIDTLDTMSPMGSSGFLDGQLLLAMPGMPDDRFARTVIYICAHSPEGAMGLVINKPAADIAFPSLLEQLEIISAESPISLPERAERFRVLKGGPVETGRGFVLHSDDFTIDNSTLTIDDGICLTATVDILRAIAAGNGPARGVLALGYAGWGAGQLESEINENGWLNCPADPALVFDEGFETKYDRAMQKIGIDLTMLSSAAGHA
jgi:putative transcriptional regulator